jgi:ABC-type transporter Mla MlaB component
MGAHSDRRQDTPVQLANDLVIDELAALKAQLRGALQSCDVIRIDPSAIRTIDTAAMQLLAAFVNRANALSKTVNWCGFSETLTSVATLLDLRRHLGLKASEENN